MRVRNAKDKVCVIAKRFLFNNMLYVFIISIKNILFIFFIIYDDAVCCKRWYKN